MRDEKKTNFHLPDIPGLEEKLYRKILETANDAIFVADAETGIILHANPRAAELIGRPREQVIGMHQADLHPSGHAEEYREIFREHVQAGTGIQANLVVQHSGGAEIPVEISASLLDLGEKKLLQGIFHDLRPRQAQQAALQNTEEALDQTHRRFREIYAFAPVSIWVEDISEVLNTIEELRSQGVENFRKHYETHPELVREILEKVNVVDVNDATLKMFRAPSREALLRGIPQTFTPDSFNVFRTQLTAFSEGATSFESEAEVQTLEGEARHILLRAHRLTGSLESGRLLVSMMDITALREARDRQEELQDELLQAQKMESIGRLAGGIAHDFNNVLSIILGYCDILRRKLPEGSAALDDVAKIAKGGQTAAALTRQLLAFSRKQVLELKKIDLRKTVETLAVMLRRTIGEHILFEIEPGESSPVVLADPIQIEQILLNLTVNARDAMSCGGRLTIELSETDVNAASVLIDTEVEPGRYAVLSVSDTGDGIPKEIQGQIFEPFFTTKPAGHGTGLGLSTVYGLVKQHKGFLAVESEPGRGTTFRVGLPVHRGGIPKTGVTTIPPEDDTEPESVLVVDDEEGIRKLVRDILELSGHLVLEAADGDETLRLLETSSPTPRVIVTDMVMPKMGGGELANLLREKYPDMRILFMTGYSEEMIGPLPRHDEKSSLIYKPFTPRQFTEKIRQLLKGN